MIRCYAEVFGNSQGDARAMKPLSGLDASFLHLETPEMPMHIGGLNLFDLPTARRSDFYEKVKSHIAGRLHLSGVFTRKLALMPLEFSNPVWIEDTAVDIDYHVRKITLPKPGSMQQLESCVAKLHAKLLDRSRPLWEFTVFDGLKSGQTAFYFKVHHAALDGQGAQSLAQAVLDVTPVPRKVGGVEAAVAGQDETCAPDVKELIGAAVRNNLAQYWNLIKSLPAAARAVGEAVTVTRGDDGKSRFGLPKSFKFAPKTPLNVSITPRRAFATVCVPVGEAKEISNAFGGSLNDVAMAICSGALRYYLQDKNVLPAETLVAAIPVSLREPGNVDSNNQVSMMLIDLATHVADPKKRMREIVKSSTALKATLKNVKSVLPTDFPGIGLPWLMSGLTALYGRSKLADRMSPIANVIISNVPGARVPLYLAGAKMTANFPVSIVVHGVALNITIQSYLDSLDFGLVACRDAVPDLDAFAGMIIKSHGELLQIARKPDSVKRQKASDMANLATPPAKSRRSTAKSATDGAAKSRSKSAQPEVKSSPSRARKQRPATIGK